MLQIKKLDSVISGGGGGGVGSGSGLSPTGFESSFFRIVFDIIIVIREKINFFLLRTHYNLHECNIYSFTFNSLFLKEKKIYNSLQA